VRTNLTDRLREVIGGAIPRVAPDASVRIVERPSLRRSAVDVRRVADTLEGRLVQDDNGAVIIVDRHYGAQRVHGRERIGWAVETLESGGDALAVLSRAWPQRASASPQSTVHSRSVHSPRSTVHSLELCALGQKLCFLDLETTGLTGGAGTQVFLVGCAIVEDGGLRIRQFLLPGFEHERTLLSTVADWMAGQGALVTFNGRTFDVPLIETRYLLHRLSFPFADTPHLDMLHPARRLWKQRPSIAGPPLDDDSCRLSVLERHLAGYHRIGDVPGFEIPSRYFRFVRDGDARPLQAVLEHNRIDLISLALVTAHAVKLIAHGPAATSQPRECLGLGRLYERAGLPENAEACFAHAVSLASRVGREPDVHGEALCRLALCRRRAGRMADAASAWQEVIAVPGCPAMLRREAREALAIHHEHRSRDLNRARMFVLDALAETPGNRWRHDAEHRLKRIERKIAVRKRGGLMAALED